MDEKTVNTLKKAVSSLKEHKDLVSRQQKEIKALQEESSKKPVPPNQLTITVEQSKELTEAASKLNENVETSNTSLKELVLKTVAAIQGFKIPTPQVTVNNPEEISIKRPSWIAGLIDLSPVTRNLDAIYQLLSIPKEIVFPEIKIPEVVFPKDAKDPVAVRLSDGKKFIEQLTQAVTYGGGGSGAPRIESTAAATRGVVSVPVVNPDGSNISGGGGGGDASAANQTSGNQKTQIVDSGGEAVTVTGGKLDVNASVDTTGLATSAKQDSLLTELQLKADLTETQPVSLASVPSHAVTNAGTFVVQAAQSGTWDEVGINDSGNSITVDGTITEASGATIATNTGNSATSLAILDDWDESDRAKVNPIVGVAGVAAGVGATGTSVQRIVPANDVGKTLVSKGGLASSSGDNTLVAAGTARLKVYAFSLSTVSTTAVTAIFQSGAAGTEIWRVILQTPASVAGGANLAIQPPAWLFATASATLLNLNLSAAVAVNWSLSYYDEA